jgi:hypothetical protein
MVMTLQQMLLSLLFGLSYYLLYRLRRYRLLVLVLAALFGGIYVFGLIGSDPSLSIWWRLILLLSGALLNIEGAVILLIILKRRNP